MAGPAPLQGGAAPSPESEGPWATEAPEGRAGPTPTAGWSGALPANLRAALCLSEPPASPRGTGQVSGGRGVPDRLLAPDACPGTELDPTPGAAVGGGGGQGLGPELRGPPLPRPPAGPRPPTCHLPLPAGRSHSCPRATAPPPTRLANLSTAAPSAHCRASGTRFCNSIPPLTLFACPVALPSWLSFGVPPPISQTERQHTVPWAGDQRAARATHGPQRLQGAAGSTGDRWGQGSCQLPRGPTCRAGPCPAGSASGPPTADRERSFGATLLDSGLLTLGRLVPSNLI